jgi:hypothetical protein
MFIAVFAPYLKVSRHHAAKIRPSKGLKCVVHLRERCWGIMSAAGKRFLMIASVPPRVVGAADICACKGTL